MLYVCVQEQVRVLQEQLQVNIPYAICYLGYSGLCLKFFDVIAVWCTEDEYHFKLIIRRNVGGDIIDTAW